MKAHVAFAAALVSTGVAPAARAAEAPCWIDGGVLVVSASVKGIAGDYILDTGSAATQLHETRAQGAGHAETVLRGEVRLAGLRAVRDIAVADLDARTVSLPTPIAGVIGADLLRGYVLDVSLSPCRVGLYRQGRAPPFGRAAALPLAWRGGLPAVPAAVADGPHARRAWLVPATGLDAEVRLDERVASVPGALRPETLYPYGRGRAQLRALSLGGGLHEALTAGLLKARSRSPDPAGAFGLGVLQGYRARFDFPRGRMLLAPTR